MKVAFWQSGFESLGLEYLSSSLKKIGYSPKLFFEPALFDDREVNNPYLAPIFDTKNKLIRDIIDYSPDILAFSSLTDNFSHDLLIANTIKKALPKNKIIFGGVHATSVPEYVLSHPSIDHVCIGEGEEAFIEFVKAVEEGKSTEKIRNIWSKDDSGNIIKTPLRPLISDIDNIPFPDKELFYKKAPYFKDTYNIISSRGCILNCNYCVNSTYHRLYKNDVRFRRRSIKNILSELIYAEKTWEPVSFAFKDDMFLTDKEWILSFFSEYEKHISTPFCCMVHPGYLDEEIISSMKNAGCVSISIGVQNMSQVILKRFNRKQSGSIIINNCRLLRKYKIPFTIGHICGMSNNAEKESIDSFRIYSRLKPMRVNFYFLTYYPGTELTRKALKDGILTKEKYSERISGHSTSYFETGDISIKEYQRLKSIAQMIPFLPYKIMDIVIKKKLYKILPKSYVFSGFLQDLVNIYCVLSGKEPKNLPILKKYLIEIPRILYRKIGHK